MTKIIQIGDKRLRQVCDVVLNKDIKTAEIKKIIGNMANALNERDDGVAISAPQIGVTKRIFIVSNKIFDEDYLAGNPKKKKYSVTTFINPKITKTSKKTETIEEGCLSINGVYGLVKRPKNVTIEAQDETGEKIIRGAGGILARIFQHEIDHLDGILFIDKATKIKEIKNEKNDNKK